MTSKDSIHKRLANQLALEQYSYDLLRDKVTEQIEGRNRQRKQEIHKQLIAASNQYQKTLNSVTDKVLRQVEDKRNLAQAERKDKAEIELREEKIRLQEQKAVYYKLVEQDHRVAQIINDLKNHSETQSLKEQLVLRNLQQKREKLLLLLDESKIKQETLIETIDHLQSQL